MRQGRPASGLVQHGEPANAWPQHQAGAAVGTLERSPLIARRLVEMLVVRRQILEGIGRAELVLGEWKITEPGLATVRH